MKNVTTIEAILGDVTQMVVRMMYIAARRHPYEHDQHQRMYMRRRRRRGKERRRRRKRRSTRNASAVKVRGSVRGSLLLRDL